MASEYYFPFDFGGSEWSTYYLANGLVKKGYKVTILTPNYGAKKMSIDGGIRVKRFPFVIKKIKSVLTPYWHTNILWILITTIYLLIELKKEKYDLLHLQGKYFSIPAFLVSILIKIPIIITIRDYQILCPHGLCLWNKQRRCSFKYFLFKEVPLYQKIYMNKSGPVAKVLNYVFSIRLWVHSRALSAVVKKMNKLVCISSEQAKIYKANGFNVTTIYNTSHFQKQKRTPKSKGFLLYVGRLTTGKGVELLVDAFSRAVKSSPKIKLLIIGEGFLKEKIRSKILKLKLNGRISLLGKVPHKDVLKFIEEAKLVVVPSIWPEPFGRVALESLSIGVPVVATNRGGLKEIVINDKYGVISSASSKNLSTSILKALKNNQTYRRKIKSDFGLIKYKFEAQPTSTYIKLYQNLG